MLENRREHGFFPSKTVWILNYNIYNIFSDNNINICILKVSTRSSSNLAYSNKYGEKGPFFIFY